MSETITPAEVDRAIRAANLVPGPPVALEVFGAGETWVQIGDHAPRLLMHEPPAPADGAPAAADPQNEAAALLAQALANNPIDRDLIVRAYALLKGLETR